MPNLCTNRDFLVPSGVQSYIVSYLTLSSYFIFPPTLQGRGAEGGPNDPGGSLYGDLNYAAIVKCVRPACLIVFLLAHCFHWWRVSRGAARSPRLHRHASRVFWACVVRVRCGMRDGRLSSARCRSVRGVLREGREGAPARPPARAFAGYTESCPLEALTALGSPCKYPYSVRTHSQPSRPQSEPLSGGSIYLPFYRASVRATSEPPLCPLVGHRLIETDRLHSLLTCGNSRFRRGRCLTLELLAQSPPPDRIGVERLRSPAMDPQLYHSNAVLSPFSLSPPHLPFSETRPPAGKQLFPPT